MSEGIPLAMSQVMSKNAKVDVSSLTLFIYHSFCVCVCIYSLFQAAFSSVTETKSLK